jgi:hypothetical protein
MDTARRAQALAGRFHHDPLADRHCTDRSDLVAFMIPGLTCGSSPVSFSTNAHISRK